MSADNTRTLPSGASPSSLHILDLELLALIKREPTTGYDLKKSLAEVFDLQVSFGTLYPHLKKLSDEGLLEGNWLPSRDDRKATAKKKKVFNLTELGRKALLDNLAALEKVSEVIQSFSN